jgi:CBS domain-containing protein
MIAADVMNAPVITAKPEMSVEQVARIFLQRHISAMPVVDTQGKLIGIISESDLLHRSETGTERQRPWWLVALTSDEILASEYVKARGSSVSDLMTRKVITAEPDTPLSEIAILLEKNAIKRIPILVNGQPIGIVSRADLLYALVMARHTVKIPLSDRKIREQLLAHLKKQAWSYSVQLNVTVNNGIVDLWGISDSETEKKAIRIAAENISGVRAVNDHIVVQPAGAWS